MPGGEMGLRVGDVFMHLKRETPPPQEPRPTSNGETRVSVCVLVGYGRRRRAT